MLAFRIDYQQRGRPTGRLAVVDLDEAYAPKGVTWHDVWLGRNARDCAVMPQVFKSAETRSVTLQALI